MVLDNVVLNNVLLKNVFLNNVSPSEFRMRFAICLLALALSPAAIAAQPGTPVSTTTIPDAALTAAAKLRERALADSTAWDVVESLTTEVGPRLAGSEGDARAVKWAEAKFRQLGYVKVWLEPVSFPKWESSSEHDAVLGAHSQPLAITALGGSTGGTVEA